MGGNRSLARAMREVTLSSGHKMPLIGFGTAATVLLPTDALAAIFVEAIEVGYRHFDTAALYGSEESLGRAVAEALKRQLIKSRDELFITSKLWCSDADPSLVLPALKESLGRLGLEYLDLYLIHWPVRMKEGNRVLSVPKECLLEFDVKGAWKAMEECSELGLAKSIGVSNFGPKKLSQILQFCTIPPAVNQVEMHVAWRQEKLRGFCKERGIHVALRWVHEQGPSLIAKSFNKERMIENLRILEWERNLTEDELEKINGIPPNQGGPGDEFVNENGPGYKSVHELWE
ncbi:hypothetical protein SAY86_003079 [Trapa natans]|uniref:NADP-dependent oxidoreductase domain-containing protein n=1 Tax=Trapa natans TaxID=22666 RepID=A0AAN7LJ85_TRANT|nr:hypothetical protein SAY86_003079 [Trapa natans]